MSLVTRVLESGSARAKTAWPSGRMWAVAGLRASIGTSILFLAPYGAPVPHLEHILAAIGKVGIALSVYSLVLHFEGHVMDAIIRIFQVVWTGLGKTLNDGMLPSNTLQPPEWKQYHPGRH